MGKKAKNVLIPTVSEFFKLYIADNLFNLMCMGRCNKTTPHENTGQSQTVEILPTSTKYYQMRCSICRSISYRKENTMFAEILSEALTTGNKHNHAHRPRTRQANAPKIHNKQQ
ncbi:MAG TPA: hypothetical protein PLV72_02530 [Candidatus Magasanikbacteria bacterium]|nr:hypothetical protein [Candidatus Magasanikbacteria bacterium]